MSPIDYMVEKHQTVLHIAGGHA